MFLLCFIESHTECIKAKNLERKSPSIIHLKLKSSMFLFFISSGTKQSNSSTVFLDWKDIQYWRHFLSKFNFLMTCPFLISYNTDLIYMHRTFMSLFIYLYISNTHHWPHIYDHSSFHVYIIKEHIHFESYTRKKCLSIHNIIN